MTINGSGFTGVDLGANPDNVQFGGGADAASYTVVNDSKITAVVPTDAIPGSITVTNDAGTTLTDDAFIAQPQPTITGMDPAVGGTGTIVSITGSGFDDGTDEGDQHSDLTPVVTFVAAKGTKPVKSTDVEVQDDGDLTALVPSGAATGKITVTTKGGSVQTDSFTVVPPPTIKSIAPTIALPGSTITITGTGLLTTTDVYFGPNQLDANIDSGDITIKNDTSITVTIPADGTNADDGPVTVFNQAFTPDNSIGATSKQSFNFIVDPAPDLFSLDHGKTGTIFTLQSDSGGGFLGATKVWFTANNAATDISAKFKVIDDTDMTVTVPAGAVTGPVCVENPSTDANGETGPPPGVCTPDDFTIVTKPVVQDFSALGSGSGTSATDPATVGDDISITGTGFTFATKVTIGGAPADWSYDPGSPSDTEIDTTIPPGAKTGTITVTTAAGTGTSKAKVYIIPPPLISSITPYQEVDHTIVIKGSAFANVTEVDFGSSQVTDQASTHDGLDGYTVDSTTQITVGVPEDSDSPTRITVWTSDHGYAVSAKYFYVQLPPDIDHLSSSYAKANGAVQIFAGDGNFFGTTQVSFGSLKAAKFTVSADGSTITTAVPAKASAGTVDVRVTNSLSDISAVTDADQLTIVVTPKVTGFTPGAGGSGTTVTVTGSGFTGASLVKFGTVAGSNLNVTSDTSLTIQVPDGLTPGKKYKITVTNAAGTGTSIATFTAQSTGARHHTKKKS